jgi:hypothetical protein
MVEFLCVWTILLDQPVDEVGVLLDPYGMNVLHGSEVYLTGFGTRSDPALLRFLIIKKKKKKKKKKKVIKIGE